jgi:hypothetical protein
MRFRPLSRTDSVNEELPAGRAEVLQLKGSAPCPRRTLAIFRRDFFQDRDARKNRRFPPHKTRCGTREKQK